MAHRFRQIKNDCVLVQRHESIDGYSRFSLMRASSVVKRQLTGLALPLRFSAHAATSFCKDCWSGILRSRHWRLGWLNSISALSGQLPCLGGVVDFQPFQQTAGFHRLKGFVRGSRGMGVGVVHHPRGLVGIGMVDIQQVTYLVRPVNGGAGTGDGRMALPGQGFKEHEQVADTVTFIFGVKPFGLACLWREGGVNSLTGCLLLSSMHTKGWLGANGRL